MIAELIAAAALGGLLLWMALSALGGADSESDDLIFDPVDETPRGRALLAIRDLEFDRETGKIGEADFRAIKARLSWEAVRILDREVPDAPPSGGPAVPEDRHGDCPACGPRPEADARFCSRCGGRLARAA